MMTISGCRDPCSLERDGDRFVSGCWVSSQARVWGRVAGGYVAACADVVLPIDAAFFEGDIVVGEPGVDAAAPPDCGPPRADIP